MRWMAVRCGIRISPDSSKLASYLRYRPCLKELRLELALPSSVFGPVLFCALARLAANWASVIITTESRTGPCSRPAKFAVGY
jgi:hypothetical protein